MHYDIYCVVGTVQNPDGWALMGHVKYLNGDNEAARECYERTLSFVTDASEMHSIYLRLASIYLQDGEVCSLRLIIPPPPLVWTF